MPIERRNPLPKGRYWADIVDSPKWIGARLTFAAWLQRNAAKVRVVSKQEFGAMTTGKARDWYLFDVLEPVTWERNQGWGLPSTVKSPENPNAPVVTKPEDTAQRPPTPTSTDMFSDLFADVKTIGWLALGIYLWSQMGGRR